MIDEWKLTLPLLEWPKADTLLFYTSTLSITPDDFTHQRRASGWERVN